MRSFLETPVEFLKGVGPQRAEALKLELGVYTFYDLLTLYPFRYVDRSRYYKAKEVHADMPYVQIKGFIRDVHMAGEKRGKRLIAYVEDDTGSVELVWFQGIKWVLTKLKPDKEYIVFGKPSLFNNKINIAHPEVEEASEENLRHASAFQAMYNSSEKLKTKNLESKGISRLQKTLSENINGHIPETLPAETVSKLKLLSREEAFRNIHFPANAQMLVAAQNRLKLEELFYLQLQLLAMKAYRKNKYQGLIFSKVGELFNSFYSHSLPFELTNAQKRVIKEIRQDMGSGKQMNRLLQGDVGSGKTLVALMSMLIALDNGYQTCMMAPTEILAIQHYETISALLKNLPLKVALLTGSTKSPERKKILQQLESRELHILVGTHALIVDDVKFSNLGLVVIDEQHRFGVEQRAKMWYKNNNPPHMLVMTATPIPRTLAMALYGDLDTSVIDEMPPGRKPIKTVHRYDSQRLKVFKFMEEQISLGRQIYVVYPLIEESEKMDYKDLMDGYESISRAFPLPKYNISIVHGRMKSADRDFEMNRFARGETQIMVATTVIEVGVNVPNASVMVIESAERFGLSQLHQLRGRVGRGADQSYCILMTSFKLSAESKIRLETMERTTDGFEISDVDLRLRGPGDFAGTRQSGVVGLKIADLSKDGQMLQLARNLAEEILQTDPNLQLPENKVIGNRLNEIKKDKPNWSNIG